MVPAPRVGLNGRSAAAMAYQPIENYGIIGNMRTAALVGMNGSIDWFAASHRSIHRACSPPSWTTRREAGSRSRPAKEGIRAKQFYWPETNVLVTRFLSPDGVGELVDFMPVGLPRESPWQDQLIRRVKVTRGTLAFEWDAVRPSIMRVCRIVRRSKNMAPSLSRPF